MPALLSVNYSKSALSFSVTKATLGTMNRREVLRNVVLAAGGFIALPTWAEAWNPSSVRNLSTFLSGEQEALLTSIVDTIIPTTDTPGAKDLGVPAFIQKMLADCYEKDIQENFIKGLEKTEAIAKDSYLISFGTCTQPKRPIRYSAVGDVGEMDRE
jgi:hypothetical protein